MRKVVWGQRLIRERSSGGIWHRPDPCDKPFCGTVIRDWEDVAAKDAEMMPDNEFCTRCSELYDEDKRRRLGQAYALLLELAASKRNQPAVDTG